MATFGFGDIASGGRSKSSVLATIGVVTASYTSFFFLGAFIDRGTSGQAYYGLVLVIQAAALLFGVPAGLSLPDVMLARGLTAFGDAFITGMLVAIFVAFRPQWLATYSDRLYLPRD